MCQFYNWIGNVFKKLSRGVLSVMLEYVTGTSRLFDINSWNHVYDLEKSRR